MAYCQAMDLCYMYGHLLDDVLTSAPASWRLARHVVRQYVYVACIGIC